MRTVTALVAGGLIAAAGLAGGRVSAALQEGGGAAAAPGRVAFVNLGKVFASHPKAKKLQEGLRSEAEQLESFVGGREEELRKEAQDLESRLTKGTPEYQEGRKRIEMRLAELQYDQKEGMALIRRKQVTGMAAVYREVAAEAERIASERGFTAVLTVDGDPIEVEENGQVMGANDLKLQMALRTVLWADPAADITGAVLAALVE